MQSVLLSIRPKWCELIASGKKTIEVRRTRPKLETPFKCYIYETLGKMKRGHIEILEEVVRRSFQIRTSEGRGQVIGEFACDAIDEYSYDYCDGVDIDDDTILETALDREDINIYAKGKTLYGWHISNLKIYDKPRELSEFGRGCDAENIGEIHCRDCKKLVSFDDCCEVMCKPLNRPPRSYIFVEEV